MSLIYEFTNTYGTHYIDLDSVKRLFVFSECKTINIIFEETEEGVMSVPYDEKLIELFKTKRQR